MIYLAEIKHIVEKPVAGYLGAGKIGQLSPPEKRRYTTTVYRLVEDVNPTMAKKKVENYWKKKYPNTKTIEVLIQERI